jgi:uncharacterized protein
VKRLILFTALALAPAMAADWSALKPQGHVNDFAGVIDPASKAELERYCQRVKEATGAEIALVTVASLDGDPVEDVANTLFRQWGIGSKERNDGVLFLLAVRERRSRLEIGYGLEGAIPDGYAGSLLRRMRPALRDNHYGDALVTAARELGQRIAAERGVPIDGTAPVVQQRREEEGPPWVPIAGLVMMLLLMLALGGRGGFRGGGGNYFMAFLLSQLLRGRQHNSGGGHGWSGGGFGGYDSGDSFGGFGGGDSGGGGASSDW